MAPCKFLPVLVQLTSQPQPCPALPRPAPDNVTLSSATPASPTLSLLPLFCVSLPPAFTLPRSLRQDLSRSLSSFLLAQKVLLLPPATVPELQVPDARAAQRDEGAGRSEESATPRLLQHP